MSQEFTIGLAFLTGLFGAFHCLGMCSGIAGGFFVRMGHWRVPPHLLYHGMRIGIYAVLGVLGALLGRVLVQSGIVGKGQGILMMVAGVLVMLIGLGLLGVMSRERLETAHTRARSKRVPFQARPTPWQPLLGGLLNGLVPCSLVFSVALQAAATADPLRAAGLMLAFGLGTLPTMLLVGMLAHLVGNRARGLFIRLAGLSVLALGGWTFYEGFVFFDIMRGLGNW